MKSLKIDYETLTENEKLLVSLLRHDSTFLSDQHEYKWPYTVAMVKTLDVRQCQWLIDSLEEFKV